MDSSTQKKVDIYVRLSEGGTEVFRPTQALDLGNGHFRLEATAGYYAEDETWELAPGSEFRGEFRSFDSGKFLVAMQATKS